MSVNVETHRTLYCTFPQTLVNALHVPRDAPNPKVMISRAVELFSTHLPPLSPSSWPQSIRPTSGSPGSSSTTTSAPSSTRRPGPLRTPKALSSTWLSLSLPLRSDFFPPFSLSRRQKFRCLFVVVALVVVILSLYDVRRPRRRRLMEEGLWIITRSLSLSVDFSWGCYFGPQKQQWKRGERV